MTAQFGYTIFYVDDVAATLDFFTAAFDIPQRFVSPDGDYGELITGETTLSFAANELAGTNLDKAGGFTPLRPSDPPVGASITLITDEVDATVERALAHGATRYTATADKPWGQTVAYVRDANGILLEIATPVAAPD
ncbi:MAG: VOC family protein [Acidimicrobiales bacterium]